jgi:hypothetical protein
MGVRHTITKKTNNSDFEKEIENRELLILGNITATEMLPMKLKNAYL